MDFSLDEQQTAVRDLASQILEERSTPEHLREVEATDDRVDRDTWGALAEAGLLGVALPEQAGGAGLDFVSAYLICDQIGRTTAAVPYLASIVMGALPIAEFGTDAQRQGLLPGAIDGSSILTAALVEPGAPPEAPMMAARPDGEGWALSGTKICVPAGMVAAHALVPAAHDDGTVSVFVVDLAANGVERLAQTATDLSIEAELTFSSVAVGAADVLGGVAKGADLVRWLVERATVAACGELAGVCESALRQTAEYTKTREQFGRQIATFQAVGQRVADAYVDTEAVRLTGLQAAWRLAAGVPAEAEVAIAKFWAAEGGQRVVHASQHVHGGIGVDRDYPVHRTFLWAKHLELMLGSATPQLEALGRILADTPA
jgi:alkylation response protein AidB-like acyl-CoA dehydrogenase